MSAREMETTGGGDGSQMIRFESSRLGEVEVPEDILMNFPGGIIGFPDQTRYVLIQNTDRGPFQWLHSVERPDLAFVVVEPGEFFDRYEVPISDEDQEQLQIQSAADVLVLVVLVVPPDPQKITANLQAPVIVNRERRLGKQLILQIPGYTTKHRIFTRPEAEKVEAAVESAETENETETETEIVGASEGGSE